MNQASGLPRVSYRALAATNTKTRRLAYLTAIISMLGHSSLGERVLLSKIARWSQQHRSYLKAYWVHTGEVTSTRRNSAGARYLRLATNLGIIAPISGAYRTTRNGLVLLALIQENGPNTNPFYLTQVERLFYLYLLLERDADILLTIASYLIKQPGASLAQIQRVFQTVFLERLNQKIAISRDDILRQRLLERRGEIERWTKPERYAEHIVPPRLNWLLDLEFLEPGWFRRHRYNLTPGGGRLISEIPQLGDAEFYDITYEWLASDFWPLATYEWLGIEPKAAWGELSEGMRRELCASVLYEAFGAFRQTAVPKVSLSQAVLYLTFRLILGCNVKTDLASLTDWLSVPQILNGRRYEVRFSPRENESYLVMMTA